MVVFCPHPKPPQKGFAHKRPLNQSPVQIIVMGFLFPSLILLMNKFSFFHLSESHMKELVTMPCVDVKTEECCIEYCVASPWISQKQKKVIKKIVYWSRILFSETWSPDAIRFHAMKNDYNMISRISRRRHVWYTLNNCLLLILDMRITLG